MPRVASPQELIAYAKALTALALRHFRVSDFGQDDRAIHYYKRLVALYGQDGRGLRRPEATVRMRVHAALIVQRFARGWLARIRVRYLRRVRAVSRKRSTVGLTRRAPALFALSRCFASCMTSCCLSHGSRPAHTEGCIVIVISAV